MILFDARAERLMLRIWAALRMAQKRRELRLIAPLVKARAAAARALCSEPKDARKAFRRAAQLVCWAYALGPANGTAATLGRVYNRLLMAAKA